MRRATFMLLLLSLCPALCRAQAELPLMTAAGSPVEWGTGKAEGYDVAYHLADRSLVGAMVKGVEIPFMASNGIGDVSVWLSGTLKLENKVNVPDICSVTATPSGGKLSVKFSEPVPVPEEGLYVGYSFTVTELNGDNEAPVTVATLASTGDFYVHSTRKYLKWDTYNLPMVAVMTILLEGDFHQEAVAVMPPADAGALAGEDFTAPVVIRNHGIVPVESIDMEIATPAGVISRHHDFSDPVPAVWFDDVEIEVPLTGIQTPGEYGWCVNVTKVNGVANPDPEREMSGYLYSYPSLPSRRPFVEEFTGTWCGWCPRGTVGASAMSREYPDEFVLAVYHKENDVMNINAPYPMEYVGSPSAWFDRTEVGDPYNGLSTETVKTYAEGIGKVWNDRREVFTPGEISVKAGWTDKSRTVIAARSVSSFVRHYSESPFRVLYILTADGLKGEGSRWSQKNYFAGRDEYRGTDLEGLVDMPALISDIEFDDVVVYTSDPDGIEGSIPSPVGMLVPVVHSHEIALADALNQYGETLIQDKDRLHLVAVLIDSRTSEVVNCARTEIGDWSGIETVGSEGVTVCGGSGSVTVTGDAGMAFQVYSVDGVLLGTGLIDDTGECTVSIPEGIVLVKILSGNRIQTAKVFVGK